jgi:hypothetical protein
MSSAYPESQEAPAPADEETEVWWGSFAGRTLAPGFVLCVLATAGALIALYAGDVSPNPRRLAYLLVSPLWIVQAGCWLYRMTAYNYRLTTRRLFVSRRFAAAATAVDLARVERVRVQRGRLGRLLGVGRIRVEAAGARPLLLEGVLDPADVAALIASRAEQARKHGGRPG